jgi:hypothetical protein
LGISMMRDQVGTFAELNHPTFSRLAFASHCSVGFSFLTKSRNARQGDHQDYRGASAMRTASHCPSLLRKQTRAESWESVLLISLHPIWFLWSANYLQPDVHFLLLSLEPNGTSAPPAFKTTSFSVVPCFHLCHFFFIRWMLREDHGIIVVVA